MVKDLISLLYIYDLKPWGNLSRFSKTDGFILNACDDITIAGDQAVTSPPDLILVEPLGSDPDMLKDTAKDLLKARYKIRPAFFLILQDYPESEKRMALLHQGWDDFLIQPFSTEEVKQKLAVYQHLGNSRHKNLVQGKKLEKTIAYLDKFKKELTHTKTELMEERVALNYALKQVNQMTREKSRFKNEIKKIKQVLRDSSQGFGDIFANLIRTKIEKNRGHNERVTHIASFIAKELQCHEKSLEDLSKAAMLHELGLLFIPEELLMKSMDQMTGYEKKIWIQYPVKGADILSKLSEFENAALIIRALNENADGSGHPDGLKRKYIPLLSRILAGADVFDTLRDDATATGLETILKKLEGYAGTRLDPSIVASLGKYAVLHMGSDSYRVEGIGIHQLEPGMTLGTALFTNTGTKLFSVNTLLTREAIDKIKNYIREYPVDETVYITRTP